jgi:hypothetical protein
VANVNYDDERFQQVTREQNQAIQNVQNTYNNMIAKTQQYYDAQAKAAEDYGNQQKALQQQNTDFTIQKIEQQKEQAEKDYTKEQKGAYVDWQKQSNAYGVNAEQRAAAGFRGSGYSESIQNDMYGQYQNRVISAKESYDRAVLEYDNGIKEAQLTNNTKLAEIAYNALKTKLEVNLQGFQYKNQLLATQIQQTQALNDTYYNRWKDVLSQINTENALAEQQRQYEEQMAMQRQVNSARYGTSGGGSRSGSGGSYSISKSSSSTSNQPTKVNGKKVTATNDYIQAANGEYLQLYKTKDGSLYYWDGSSYKAWSEKKKSSNVAKVAKNIGSLVNKANSSGGGRHG